MAAARGVHRGRVARDGGRGPVGGRRSPSACTRCAASDWFWHYADERARRPGARRHAGAAAAAAARPAAGAGASPAARSSLVARRCWRRWIWHWGPTVWREARGRAVPRRRRRSRRSDHARGGRRSSAASPARRRSCCGDPPAPVRAVRVRRRARRRCCPRRARARCRGSTRASETTWGRRSSRPRRPTPAGAQVLRGAAASTTSSLDLRDQPPDVVRRDPAPTPRSSPSTATRRTCPIAPGPVRDPARRRRPRADALGRRAVPGRQERRVGGRAGERASPPTTSPPRRATPWPPAPPTAASGAGARPGRPSRT